MTKENQEITGARIPLSRIRHVEQDLCPSCPVKQDCTGPKEYFNVQGSFYIYIHSDSGNQDIERAGCKDLITNHWKQEKTNLTRKR
jgi:hypothetical protein